MLKFHFRSNDFQKADGNAIIPVNLCPLDCFLFIAIEVAVCLVAIYELDFVSGFHYFVPLSFLSDNIIHQDAPFVNTLLKIFFIKKMECLFNIPFTEIMKTIRESVPSIFILTDPKEKNVRPITEGGINN